MSLRCDCLSNFTFMMRENQVHTTTVDIKVFTQIFLSHRRTFAMPSGETITPRRRPAHDMFRLCTLPKSKVYRVMLLFLSVEGTRRIDHILDIPS